jgi:hypothetical protein
VNCLVGEPAVGELGVGELSVGEPTRTLKIDPSNIFGPPLRIFFPVLAQKKEYVILEESRK